MKRIASLILVALMTITLSGCGKTTDKNVAVNDVIVAVEEKVEFPASENYTDMARFEQEYYVNGADIEEFVVKKPKINVSASEVAIIKVKEAGKVEDVKASVEKHVKDLETQWEHYLPDQLELVKNAKINTFGNYVVLIISPDAEQVENIIQEQLK